MYRFVLSGLVFVSDSISWEGFVCSIQHWSKVSFSNFLEENLAITSLVCLEVEHGIFISLNFNEDFWYF